MSQARAFVFDAPKTLSVPSLELKPFQAADLEVEVSSSDISTGSERLLWDGTVPPFPGPGLPLVPGYETVGTVVRVGASADIRVGETVFIPGSYSFQGVRNIFGGAGSRLIVAHDRTVRVAPELGPNAVLLALAATCYHAVAFGCLRQPMVPPELIVGHGVMVRLLARICLAQGWPAPTVWETQPARRGGATGYPCVHADEDSRKNYTSIVDVSGDGSILNGLISRLPAGGEVVPAGFYKQDLAFAFAPAFMREAPLRIAAQSKKHDLRAVTALVESGAMSLEGLITHTFDPGRAREAYEVAFGDPQCLKMIDWQA